MLKPPKSVLDLSSALERAGFQAWCVGGAVRDALLGHPHLDWDIATSATPAEVRELFGRKRTIPVGVEFGTVGVLDRDGILHEVTTFRRDIKTDGRHAEVEFGASLEEDLARRDFTINAIAYSPATEEIRDPFGGREDLSRRLVRAVGEPDARMREDRLRALRAIRFAARFGFSIEPGTLASIERSAPHLGRLSPERVKQELEKTMDQVARPAAALALWKRTGALATLIPDLASIDDRTIAALDCLAMPGPFRRPNRRLTRLAVLFVELPEAKARAAISGLRFSKAEVNRVAGYASRWSAIGAAIIQAIGNDAPVPDVTIRRWVSAMGRLDVGPLMRLVYAMSASRAEAEAGALGARLRRIYRRMLVSAFGDQRRRRDPEPLEIRDLAIDGDDLQQAGIQPGPIIGKILQALLEAVLEDPTRNTRDWLLHEATRLAGVID
jgi:tRNA nucleotidyltransferase (CCA-adding enzyme)